MKMLNKYLIVAVAAASMASCAKEDLLVAVPDTLTDVFAPAPDATDEESVMRRDFYDTEHSYLLFNDTLRYDSVSVAPNGKVNYRKEMLDLDYTIGQDKNSFQTAYVYEFIPTLDEKKQAVSFLKTYVTSNLPDKMRPFSWFLVNKVQSGRKYPLLISKQRAAAVAVSTIMPLDEAGKREVGMSIASTIIAEKLPSQACADFYKVSRDYYNKRVGRDMALFYAAGFIVQGPYGKAPLEEDDLKSYIELLFNKTLAEVQADVTYQGYPMIQEKAVLAAELCNAFGVAIKK